MFYHDMYSLKMKVWIWDFAHIAQPYLLMTNIFYWHYLYHQSNPVIHFWNKNNPKLKNDCDSFQNINTTSA